MIRITVNYMNMFNILTYQKYVFSMLLLFKISIFDCPKCVEIHETPYTNNYIYGTVLNLILLWHLLCISTRHFNK